MKPKILMIDDTPAHFTMLLEILGGEYDPSISLSGEDGLLTVAKDSPDLILLDMVLPGIQGWEVLGKLRANPLTKQIPVILISATAPLVDLGADGFLLKPFKASAVREKIRKLLENTL